jgi:hypothetical protein
MRHALGAGRWASLVGWGDPNNGIAPTLFIPKRCARLIETVALPQYDPDRPLNVVKVDADEEGVGGDDCADALRYLVATKARTVQVRKLRGIVSLKRRRDGA